MTPCPLRLHNQTLWTGGILMGKEVILTTPRAVTIPLLWSILPVSCFKLCVSTPSGSIPLLREHSTRVVQQVWEFLGVNSLWYIKLIYFPSTLIFSCEAQLYKFKCLRVRSSVRPSVRPPWPTLTLRAQTDPNVIWNYPLIAPLLPSLTLFNPPLTSLTLYNHFIPSLALLDPTWPSLTLLDPLWNSWTLFYPSSPSMAFVLCCEVVLQVLLSYEVVN